MLGLIYDTSEYRQFSSEQLAKWKRAGIVEDYQGEVLDLSGKKGWKDNALIVRNCPNLKILYAPNLGLRSVDIDAPQLESLNLHGNYLTDLELTKTLEDGSEVSKFPLLETLTVSENPKVIELELQSLPNLIELFCFKCSLDKLDCSNLPKLWHLSCANQFSSLFSLNVQGCNNLEILDAAENWITNLDCSNLTKLKSVSIKECCSPLNKEYINDFIYYFKACVSACVQQSKNNYLSSRAKKKIKDDSIEDSRLKKRVSQIFFLTLHGTIAKKTGRLSRYYTVKQFNSNVEKCLYAVLAGNDLETEVQKMCDFLPNTDTFFLNANFENCTSLEDLGFAKSIVGGLNVNGCSNLRRVTGGWLIKKFDLDENGDKQYEPALTKVLNGWEVQLNELTDEGKWKIELIPDSEYDAWMKRWKNGEIQCKKQPKTKSDKPTRYLSIKPWYDPNFWKDSKRFPNLETIDIDNPKADEYEDPNYGPRIHAYQQQQKRDAFINGSVKTYQGQECLDLSGIGLTKAQMDGKLGFYPPSLKSINLGNNGLHTVEIKNFPNLEQLILSHNALTKPLLVLSNEEYGTLVESEGFVEVHQKYNLIVNCPKLKPQDLEVDSDIAIAQGLHKTLYGYKSDDPTRKSAEERVYDEQLDNKYRQATVLNDLLTNPAQHTCEEWTEKINFAQVPLMQRSELIKALQQRREKEKEEQETADQVWWENYEQELAAVEEEEKQLQREKVVVVSSLIQELKEVLATKNLTASEELLKKLKNDYYQSVSEQQKETIEKLAKKMQMLKSHSETGLTDNPNISYGTAVAFIGIAALVLVAFYIVRLRNRKIKFANTSKIIHSGRKKV